MVIQTYWIHMRIATHGSVCLENNHPFHIDTQTVFAHNGIMPHEFHPPAKSDLSDTRYFNKVFLQNMKPIALDDELFRTAIGDIIGMGNKLVILSANKKLKQDSYIINEHLGQWVKGVWYSNTAHIPSKGVKYDKTGATIGGYTQRSWNAYDGVFEAVDDSCEIEIAPDVDSSWFDEEQSFNDEYWWCETIPEEELEKESVQEQIADSWKLLRVSTCINTKHLMIVWQTLQYIMMVVSDVVNVDYQSRLKLVRSEGTVTRNVQLRCLANGYT